MKEAPPNVRALAFVRPGIAALLVTTMSCVTECSEGDGHLRASIGAGSGWLDWHAMPDLLGGYLYLPPDHVALAASQLPLMLCLAVLTVIVFAVLERFDVGAGPFGGTVLAWCASWLGTVLPFPFFFLGFFAAWLLLPAIVIGIFVSIAMRQRGPPTPK